MDQKKLIFRRAQNNFNLYNSGNRAMSYNALGIAPINYSMMAVVNFDCYSDIAPLNHKFNKIYKLVLFKVIFYFQKFYW